MSIRCGIWHDTPGRRENGRVGAEPLGADRPNTERHDDGAEKGWGSHGGTTPDEGSPPSTPTHAEGLPRHRPTNPPCSCSRNLDPLAAVDVLERLLHRVGTAHPDAHRLRHRLFFFHPLLEHEVGNQTRADTIAARAVHERRPLA